MSEQTSGFSLNNFLKRQKAIKRKQDKKDIQNIFAKKDYLKENIAQQNKAKKYRPPANRQQVRLKKEGKEYDPRNIEKLKRKHRLEKLRKKEQAIKEREQEYQDRADKRESTIAYQQNMRDIYLDLKAPAPPEDERAQGLGYTKQDHYDDYEYDVQAGVGGFGLGYKEPEKVEEEKEEKEVKEEVEETKDEKKKKKKKRRKKKKKQKEKEKEELGIIEEAKEPKVEETVHAATLPPLASKFVKPEDKEEDEEDEEPGLFEELFGKADLEVKEVAEIEKMRAKFIEENRKYNAAIDEMNKMQEQQKRDLKGVDETKKKELMQANDKIKRLEQKMDNMKAGIDDMEKKLKEHEEAKKKEEEEEEEPEPETKPVPKPSFLQKFRDRVKRRRELRAEKERQAKQAITDAKNLKRATRIKRLDDITPLLSYFFNRWTFLFIMIIVILVFVISIM